MKSMRNKFFLLTTISLFIIFSALSLFLYNRTKNEYWDALNNKIERTTNQIALTSQIPLWNIDKSSLEAICKSFFENEELIKIYITNEQNEPLIKMEKDFNKGSKITKMKNVIYNSKKIGTVKTQYTTYFLNQKLKRARNIYFYVSFITYITMFIIISIISKKVTTPISKLADNLLALDINEPEKITAGIKETDITEVNSLLHSFQNMSSELASSFEELKAQNEELEDSYLRIEKLNSNLQEIIRITSALTDAVFFEKHEKFLADLLYIAHGLIPEADYGAIYLVEEEYVSFIQTIGHNLEKIKKLPLKKEYFGVEDDAIIVKDIMEKNNTLMPPDLYEKFSQASKPIKSTMLVKLKVINEWRGTITLDIAENSEKEFNNDDIETIKAFGNIASALLTMQSYKEVRNMFHEEIILSMIKILELHDTYTRGHSKGVAEVSSRIAKEIGLETEKVDQAYWAGMVHDIGKILIDRNILNKPSSLSRKEYEEIQRHPVLGYKVLKEASSEKLREIAEYVLHHHERWDGKGYPHQLKGKEIPLISQILTVADSWNAMTTNRAYREKLPIQEAIEQLKENRGTQFSPKIVDAFLDVLEKEDANIIED